MGIFSWILLGLIAGVLAKLIMPGKDPGGMVITILIGIAGAFVGGFVSSFIGFGSVTGFDVRSILVAVGGAILLLLGYRLIKKEP
ncbi:MAG: GlsB/YeaQ/YmgE family stress response membrane protein [bacterium]|nr:GlsB/YeaQ/YmgE family stress response membrane protein [bacterium]